MAAREETDGAGGGTGDTLTEMAELMALTFDVRHQDVLENNFSVKNALAIYPGLKDFQELRREFERITRKSVGDFERHLNFVLKRYAKGQIEMEETTCSNPYCKEALEILRQGDQDDENARITAARIIIYACAQSQNNWWNEILKVFEEGKKVKVGRLHPTVVVRGSPFGEKCADVFCEKAGIVRGVNFHEAILTCYYIYYVFNLSIPPLDHEIYQTFDNILEIMASKEEKGGASSSSAGGGGTRESE